MDIIRMGKFIADRRRALGLTQKQLAELVGITDKAVSKWERGLACPDIALVGSLAAALRCKSHELLSGQIVSAAESSDRTFDKKDAQTEGKDPARDVVIVPDGKATACISPLLFGNNLEHTRSSVFFGLSAQMLKNRKFAGKPGCGNGCAAEWFPIGEKSYLCFDEPYTRHAQPYHMHRNHECNSQAIANFQNATGGIGQHGLFLQKDKAYEFRMAVKTRQTTDFSVTLCDRYGKKTYVRQEISLNAPDWETVCLALTPEMGDEDGDLRITFSGVGTVWIGAVSLMPADHFRGMRTDVIEKMQQIGIRILRWPGGNFAGEYSWFDGLLPTDMRAPLESWMGIETQPHSMGYDYHEINTDDFVALCRRIGAEPFITVNPAWNTAEETARWVEYCNGGADTEYGRLRMERGYEQPYHVMFWSLGNEVGYGHMEGDNTPYGYCKSIRDYAKAMLQVDPGITLCASGPYPNEDWVSHAAIPLADQVPLVSLHRYIHYPNFHKEDPKQAYEQFMAEPDRQVRGVIRMLRQQLGNAKLSISFDEWNSWYSWYRRGSVCDALFAAGMFHVFMGEAEPMGVDIVCHFEAVNEGCIRVSADRAELTPTGKVFSLMKRHENGKLCFVDDDAVATCRDGEMTVTLLNRSYDREKTFILEAEGEVRSARLYTAPEITPPSEFTETDVAVAPQDGVCRIVLPPHSLMLLCMKWEEKA